MSDLTIVERDHAALSAMLDAALAKAQGRRGDNFVLDYGLPPARDPMPEHATYWSADRGYLKHCWGPVDVTARQVAEHPSEESVAEPPSAMMCSARLA